MNTKKSVTTIQKVFLVLLGISYIHNGTVSLNYYVPFTKELRNLTVKTFFKFTFAFIRVVLLKGSPTGYFTMQLLQTR